MVGKTEDFTIVYDNQKYNVIVEEPLESKDKYPLIIYNHGGGYKTLEPFDLRRVAERLSEEGFLVWIPERSLWLPEEVLGRFSEAKGVSKTVLDIALQHPNVDKDNINLIGFSLGSWAVLEENIYSEDVKSISLLGFGAPFDHTVLYDHVFKLVNEIDYGKVSAEVLIMTSKGDTRVNIDAGEILRSKMVEAGKNISAMSYEEGDHLSMAGIKPYLDDLVKFLKGEEVNLESGEKITLKDVATEPTKGKIFAYVGDTYLSKGIYKTADNSDFMLIGSTFQKEHDERAEARTHLTSYMAGNVAKRSNAKKLMLYHFSASYTDLNKFRTQK